MRPIISLVLSLLLIFPIPLFADVPELPPQPRITGIQEGEAAPYSGVLLNTIAAAQIFVDKDHSQEECGLRIQFEVEKETQRMNLLLDSMKVTLESAEERHNSILEIKNQEIERLSEIASETPNDYSMWWFAGGVIAGIGLTIGVAFAINEVN